MVVILYERGCKKYAQRTAKDIAAAFARTISTRVLSAEVAHRWTDAPAHDDLLVVIFRSTAFPKSGEDFIEDYVARRPHALILPVAITAAVRVPPAAARAYKALQYSAGATGKDGHLARRVGGMLGLRLQGRDARIFLSHRATDGARIARQLYEHFDRIGYRPYLDEARDLDGDTKILPGSQVQSEIDGALANASLVLLIDTPDVLDSLWIKHEIDTANGMMVPVLPICFRLASDSGKGPRFRSLLSLQRWEDLALPAATKEQPLPQVELDVITSATEQFLCEVFRRRCRVPFLVRSVFESTGFVWSVLDEQRLMYRSSRSQARVHTRVLSHCSIFEQVYAPALDQFREVLQNSNWANHSLFIYDGPLLPDSALTDIYDPDSEDRFLILHHQELASLIHSNFTTLGKP